MGKIAVPSPVFAMPFSNANYQAIITILELSPDEYRTGSHLRWCGGNLEDLDAETGSTFVTEVQQAIADWQTANTSYSAAISSDEGLGYQSQTVSGEYSLSWGARGGAAKYDNYLKIMRDAEGTIARLLQWDKTSRYSGSVGRTIS